MIELRRAAMSAPSKLLDLLPMSRRRCACQRQPTIFSFPAPGAAALALLALSLGFAGCATLPNGTPDPRDRFERFNRSVYAFNVALDHAILRPIARAYVKVAPQRVRTGVNNFMTNLAYPATVANSFLQGKIQDGVTDTARLVVNTTVGIGGLFDPATNMGLDRHVEDFGQTLGRWGLHDGPYLMLPLLGPSTVRDAFGLVPDYLLLHEIESVKLFGNDASIEWSLFAVSAVNQRAQLLDEDKILERTYDPYAFLRSAYLQRRAYLIRDGEMTPEEEFPDTDTNGEAAPAAPGASPPAAPAASAPGQPTAPSPGAPDALPPK
ncbi:MAG: VacJ family lipoprotein [Steroidobacterales bacterium]